MLKPTKLITSDKGLIGLKRRCRQVPTTISGGLIMGPAIPHATVSV